MADAPADTAIRHRQPTPRGGSPMDTPQPRRTRTLGQEMTRSLFSTARRRR